jgi:hypothetical protein
MGEQFKIIEYPEKRKRKSFILGKSLCQGYLFSRRSGGGLYVYTADRIINKRFYTSMTAALPFGNSELTTSYLNP